MTQDRSTDDVLQAHLQELVQTTSVEQAKVIAYRFISECGLSPDDLISTTATLRDATSVSHLVRLCYRAMAAGE